MLTLMKPMSGPIDRSTLTRPAIAMTVSAKVARISGDATMTALPIPALEIRFGPRSVATTSNANRSRIGTSR